MTKRNLHKLNGIIEAVINKAWMDEGYLAELAADPSIPEQTADEAFQSLETYITQYLADTRMTALGEQIAQEQGG